LDCYCLAPSRFDAPALSFVERHLVHGFVLHAVLWSVTSVLVHSLNNNRVVWHGLQGPVDRTVLYLSTDTVLARLNIRGTTGTALVLAGTARHGFGTVLAASWPIFEDRSVVRIEVSRCAVLPPVWHVFWGFFGGVF
jgi:hypothetical protein